MGKIPGNNAVAFINQYKIAGDANRVNANFNIDVAEVSGFEDKAKQFVEGQYGWTFGMDGYWNSASGKVDPVVQNLVGKGTCLVGIYPNGTTPASIGYDGWGLLTNYSPEATVGGAVVFSADMQGNNRLYRTTIVDAGQRTTDGTASWFNLGTSSGSQFMLVARSTGSPTGSANISIQASGIGGTTTQAENIYQELNKTGAFYYVFQGTTTMSVGPHYRAIVTRNGVADTVDLTIACSVINI